MYSSRHWLQEQKIILVHIEFFFLAEGEIDNQSTNYKHCEEIKMVSDVGVSNSQPGGYRQPRTAMNETQHKIVNLRKTFFLLIGFHSCLCIYVWPKTAVLLVWPRDDKSLDTPE